MLSGLSNMVCQPGYKKITPIESYMTYLKNIFNRYPKALLITGVALTTLGVLAITIGAVAISLLPLSITLITSGAVITTIGVSTLLATSYNWRHILAYMVAVPLLGLLGIQWTSTMNPNPIEDRSCSIGDKLLGKVQHEKNMPVLELFTEDSYEMGLAQGYLLGEQIKEVYEQILPPMMSLCGTLTGDFSGKYFSQQAKQIHIPESYRREIQGLVAGVHQWANQRGVSTTLTVEQVIAAHKLTDIYKAIGCQKILGIKGFNSFGCSTAVVKKGEEIAVGRTLDWPSLGKIGDLFYIRKHKVDGKQIEMQTFPGSVGALTAYNEDGLVAIINENGSVSKDGTPYNLLARDIIEKNKTVDQAEAMMDRDDYQPASSHHLTLVDKNRAAVYQMALGERKYVKRELDFTKDNAFLVVTNHTIDQNSEILENTICDPTSKSRHTAMSETIAKELKSGHSIDQIVKKGLQSVNTLDTVATAHYKLPIRKNSKVKVVKYTHNNYWAAKQL